MGKPRLIIIIRHAQSEGNKNRDIHQYVPDHRVKLTPEGWLQAEDAGRRLRSMLRKDDTIRIFTSPYRRTRETTEGILRTLTADDEETEASPFQREDIKVYEEPRLREQDFGNFQPCSVEMERMWQERADYGHFFYRIPNGESAADAYDRISGFNESLWRQFGYDDFPSVCVLVTHGLMGRVFLMKWYKWTVEYFEDLRNIHHCEFLIMEKETQERYDLKTTLRTWSELESRKTGPPSPKLPLRRWGGCPNGCNHHRSNFTKRVKRTSTIDVSQPQIQQLTVQTTELVDRSTGPSDTTVTTPSRQKSTKQFTAKNLLHAYEISTSLEPNDGDLIQVENSSSEDDEINDMLTLPARRRKASLAIRVGRDGGGSHSGMPSPEEILEPDGEEYFDSQLLPTQLHGSRSSYRTDKSRPQLAMLEEDADHPSEDIQRYGSTDSGHMVEGELSPKGGTLPLSNIQGLVDEGHVAHGKKVSELSGKVTESVEPEEGTPAADIY